MPASPSSPIHPLVQGHRQSRVVVITSFLDRWLDAEECEDVVEAAAHFLGGLFDVGPASEAEEADRDVSHGGHDLWGGAGRRLGIGLRRR